MRSIRGKVPSQARSWVVESLEVNLYGGHLDSSCGEDHIVARKCVRGAGL